MHLDGHLLTELSTSIPIGRMQGTQQCLATVTIAFKDSAGALHSSEPVSIRFNLSDGLAGEPQITFNEPALLEDGGAFETTSSLLLAESQRESLGTPSVDDSSTADTSPAEPQIKPVTAVPTPTPIKAALPASPRTEAEAAPVAASSLIDDLTLVRSVDPSAANRIAGYCNTATAHATEHPEEILANCRRNELNAWRRVTQSPIPPACNQPPFPDSYVAKEACAKYESHR